MIQQTRSVSVYPSKSGLPRWTFFALNIFEDLLGSWPFLKSIKVYIVKSNILPFLETEYGIGNSDLNTLKQ